MCLYIRKSENIDIYFMMPFSIDPVKYITLKNAEFCPQSVFISYDSQNKQWLFP
jgi:hypothetical protein